jgi:putative transposase
LIRRDGIRLFNLHYWDNVLSPLAGRSGQPFVVKYDPRDLSKVYLRDEKGAYWTIPYRDLGAPPITLWEHRNALRKLRVDGRNSVNERLILETIAEQREIIAAARLRTRVERLTNARTPPVENSARASARVSDQSEPKSPLETTAVAPFVVDDWS